MMTAQEAIETYIRAKDQNRPYLMEHAFATDAVLKIVVNSGTLSFPPISNGVRSISDILVRRFAQSYENVHTFCLAEPPRDDQVKFSCDWLVGMSEKDSRAVRVGCGRYDWTFQSQSVRLVERLTITIHAMVSIAPSYLRCVMTWLSQLSYPWCTADEALRHAPTFPELQQIRQYLAHESA